MAIRIEETWNSRDLGLELGGASAMAEYAITGTTDHNDAYAAVYAFVPPSFEGLSFKDLKIRPLGGPNWIATVNYGVSLTGLQVPGQSGASPPPPPPPPPAETDPLTDADGLSFSTIGGTTRIHTSLNTVSKISISGSAGDTDFKKQIGANGEGCEVFTGRLQLTFKRNFPSISMRYIKTLADLTGTVNTGTWRGVFADSALLFLGAEGEYAGPKGWPVSFQFDVGRQDKILGPTGDQIGTLPPHHYVWFLTEKRESNGKPVGQPVAAYVEQVYEKADFNKLGI